MKFIIIDWISLNDNILSDIRFHLNAFHKKTKTEFLIVTVRVIYFNDGKSADIFIRIGRHMQSENAKFAKLTLLKIDRKSNNN